MGDNEKGSHAITENDSHSTPQLSETLTLHRTWHHHLRRARRFISDFDPSLSSRGPLRLTEKRRAPGLGGLIEANKGLLFVVCVFVAFMQAGLLAGHSAHDALAVYPDAIDPTHSPEPPAVPVPERAFEMEHPIPRLMAEAEDKFRALLGKQSRSLSAAVKEYKRRYGRKPPKGFDEWWKFARENGVKMVDEFDGLVEDLAPFWAMGGQELRRRALEVSVVRCSMGLTTEMA